MNLFKIDLEKSIRNKHNSLYNYNCYLIKDTWFNKLNEILNYPHGDDINIIINKFLLEERPKFINDISSAINCLKNNHKIKLINQDFLKILYEEDYLNKKTVKYYAGNNKIIIEFKEINDYKSLLINNPLNFSNNNNIDKDQIYVLTTKNNLFYGKILSLDTGLNLNDYYNSLSSQEKENIINIEKLDEIRKYEIITILIYFFYYEKSLSLEKKDDIFKNNERYYLINPEWIKEYKKYYNYDKMFDLLNNINNNNINYYNGDALMGNLIMSLKDKIIFNTLKLSEDLINRDKIQPNVNIKEIIKYNQLSYIIPSKIMNIIEKNEFVDKDIYIGSVEIFTKENYIYISDFYTLTVGSLNEQLLYVPKYIFSYQTMDTLDLEKEKILSFSIEVYITMNNCIINNYNNIQKLEKGVLLIIDNNLNDKNKFNEKNKENKESLDSEIKPKYIKRAFAKSLKYKNEITGDIIFQNDYNYKVNLHLDHLYKINNNKLNPLKIYSLKLKKNMENNISQRFRNFNKFKKTTNNNLDEENKIILNKYNETFNNIGNCINEIQEKIKLLKEDENNDSINEEKRGEINENILKTKEEEIKKLKSLLEYEKSKNKKLIEENDELKRIIKNNVKKVKEKEEKIYTEKGINYHANTNDNQLWNVESKCYERQNIKNINEDIYDNNIIEIDEELNRIDDYLNKFLNNINNL